MHPAGRTPEGLKRTARSAHRRRARPRRARVLLGRARGGGPGPRALAQGEGRRTRDGDGLRRDAGEEQREIAEGEEEKEGGPACGYAREIVEETRRPTRPFASRTNRCYAGSSFFLHVSVRASWLCR